MKKLTTILVLAAMLLATLGLAVSADSHIENSNCTASIDIAKANPANLVKDGIISEGEYKKAEVNKADLTITFGKGDHFLAADAMANQIEYYFSWDEVHGLNIAVTYDACPIAEGEPGYVNGFNTKVPVAYDPSNGNPADAFMSGIGLSFSTKSTLKGDIPFYYSIGKTIDGTAYLTGHYGQLGSDGSYSAQGGTDFEVGYNGTKVTFEWSIPLAVLDAEGTVGSSFPFNLSATAGYGDPALKEQDANYNIWYDTFGVSLGEFGYGGMQTRSCTPATANLTGEIIPDPANKPNETTAPTTTAPVTTAKPETETVVVTETNEAGETVVVTDASGNAVTETVAVTTPGNGSSAPVTGDPMVIAAVVAAISACGVVVAKKRK